MSDTQRFVIDSKNDWEERICFHSTRCHPGASSTTGYSRQQNTPIRNYNPSLQECYGLMSMTIMWVIQHVRYTLAHLVTVLGSGVPTRLLITAVRLVTRSE
ncbi:MAG: hypothetical protein JO187_09755 [Acidobacteria bacterium]|nr:hypothetical protein [Acidobacteriota bacterium]